MSTVGSCTMEKTKDSAQENVTIFTDEEWRADLRTKLLTLRDTLEEFYTIQRRITTNPNEILNRDNLPSAM